MKQITKIYLSVAVALVTCGALFQNCAAAPPPDIGMLTNASTSPGGGGGGSVPVPAPIYTCQFAGRTLVNNETVDAYQASTVPVGGTCVKESRTCVNGALSGSFQFGGCTVQSPSATASCNFYGQTIPHGGSVLAYQASSVTGGACAAENRVCSNGTLSGTYQYTSCVVDCSFNGGVVAHNGQVQAFAAPSVPAGSSCVPEMRSCNMGTLNGSYQYSSCVVLPPAGGGTASCNFNGQVVPHGGSVYAYSTDLAPQGTLCSNWRESRMCNNGVLGGSYQFSSCQRDFDNCTTGGYQTFRTQEALRYDCP